MKRLIVLGMAAMMLAGCGSNSGQEGFTEKYNENAYEFVSVNLLDEEKFGEIEKEKYGSWKNLQTRDGYSIEAKYDDDDELTGYSIAIKEGELYYRYEGEGYEASLVMVESLGLDRDKYTGAFSKTIETDEDDVTYTDNGYEVNVFSMMSGIVINFDMKD